jgi:hypothetical protein
MKFTTCIIGIFLISIFCAAAQPKLKIQGDGTYDWGNVKEKDSPLHAKVKLYSVGTDSLKINTVKPTCGCTTAPLDKNALAPGDSATLDITLNIRGTVGDLHKTIRIECNDPKQKETYLHLRADVNVPIAFSPSRYIAFGQMYVGQEAKRSIKMINKTSERILIKDVKMEPSNIKVNLQDDDVLPPNGEIEIIATITPDKVGTFSCRLSFKTNHPDIPEVDITGWGTIDNPKPANAGDGTPSKK